jgi:hypothetical protein
MGKLSAIAIKNLKEPGRYSDGEGLILKLAAQGRQPSRSSQPNKPRPFWS